MANVFFSDAELAQIREMETGVPSLPRYSLEWLRERNCPVYFFGCDAAVVPIRTMLGGINLRGGMDNNPEKWNKTLYGLPVYSPEEGARRVLAEGGVVVLSLCRADSVAQVEAQCRRLGCPAIEWNDCIRLSTPGVPLERLGENENAARVYHSWDEEESRAVFRSVVRYLTVPQWARMRYTVPQYFIKEIPRRCYRDFVDAGAYDGDTLREFLSIFKDDFDSYHAFEPLPANLEGIVATAAGDSRITVHPAAVSDNNGRARLIADFSGSKLSERGGVEVDTVRLDDALRGANVGYVKMDVEGAEPAALRGAEEIVRSQKPALGVCVYHEPEHMWTIPDWLRGLNLGYRLLLRHHGSIGYETVCYAVPE